MLGLLSVTIHSLRQYHSIYTQSPPKVQLPRCQAECRAELISREALSASGESCLNRSTVSTIRAATKSTSSSVLDRPNPKRIEDCAISSPTPMARRTYDGSTWADVHADPEDSATSLVPIRIPSPSTNAKDKLRFPASNRGTYLESGTNIGGRSPPATIRAEWMTTRTRTEYKIRRIIGRKTGL